ncbi:hypothetical protein BJX64DRAFT_243536 [Aspergillus heterothallicus]
MSVRACGVNTGRPAEWRLIVTAPLTSGVLPVAPALGLWSRYRNTIGMGDTATV